VVKRDPARHRERSRLVPVCEIFPSNALTCSALRCLTSSQLDPATPLARSVRNAQGERAVSCAYLPSAD